MILCLVFGVAGVYGIYRKTPEVYCLMRQTSYFCDRFQTDLPVLWTPETRALGQPIREWFDFREYPFILKELDKKFSDLNFLLPNLQPMPRLRHCAVVGNGGNLRGTDYGPWIDSFDAIFRMTKAPTKGFEKDVGTRTTHHFLYGSLLDIQDLDPSAEIYFFAIGDPWDLGIGFGRLINYLKKRETAQKEGRFTPKNPLDRVNLKNIQLIHPDFIYYATQKWHAAKSGHPSTGLLAIVLAIYACESVDVFGFGQDKNGNWDHYYDPEIIYYHNRTLHNFDHETRVRKELAREGIIRVHSGNRDE